MAQQTVVPSIKEGLANARNNVDFAISALTKKKFAFTRPAQHPNKTLLQPAMKVWTLPRQTMDKSLGDNGFVVFTFKATTAAEAKKMLQERLDEINEPFLEKLRKGDKKK